MFLADNPDLGPARVVMHLDGSRPELDMLWAETRFALGQSTRLEPYPLPPGSKVRLEGGAPTEVGELLRETPGEPGGRRYFAVKVGEQEIEVDEAAIGPIKPDPADLVARLRALRWDRPTAFYARRRLLHERRDWYEDTEGLPTLCGARITPMTHQIYAAQRVLWARSPRFVLADEVGLGKTIEAGLVLQALMATDPELKVLVIAPGSMTRQWLCELYLRFGARPFQVVTDLSRRFTDQVIISTSTLNRQSESWSKLTRRKWGMVVIDEAHQHPPGSALYGLLRQLSEKTDGILVLSATPSKREVKGLLGLLALVAPDQYSPNDEERVAALWELRQEVWDKLGFHQILRDAPDFQEMPASAFAELAADWEPLLAEDPGARTLLDGLARGERSAFDDLEAYVQEYYRVDHRLIRTRRRTVEALGQPWCERRVEVVEYRPTSEESLLVEHIEQQICDLAPTEDGQKAIAYAYLRLLRLSPEQCLAGLLSRKKALTNGPGSEGGDWWQELLSDPSPQEEEELQQRILEDVPSLPGETRWLDHAVTLARAWKRNGALGARHECAIRWIETHLAAHPTDKLLVFTEDRKLAQTFAEALGRRLARTVEAFHWVDSAAAEEELKRITLEFQRSPTCPVLISDELGGEGRNFQMAEAVLHLDCPWAVARLEQRIGRLDRIGRAPERAVRSVTFLGGGTVEREIHHLHSQIFRVHERSIGGLEFLLPDLQRRVFSAAVAGAPTMSAQRGALAFEVEEAIREADQDFDQSLDTSRHELERARELASVLGQLDGENRRYPLQYWARSLGMKAGLRDDRGGTPVFSLEWSPDQLADPIPGNWGQTAARKDSGTFSRKLALEREDLQYFGPGHRLFDAQIQAISTASVGRISVFGRALGARNRGQVFALVLVQFDLDAKLLARGKFDVGLLTRARRRLHPRVIERCVRVTPGRSEEPSLVEDPDLQHALQRRYKGPESAVPVKAAVMARQDLSGLCSAIALALPLALESAATTRLDDAREAQPLLESDLGPEMGFLRGQLAQGASSGASEALRQRRALLKNLDRSRAEIVGVALIIGM